MADPREDEFNALGQLRDGILDLVKDWLRKDLSITQEYRNGTLYTSVLLEGEEVASTETIFDMERRFGE